MAAPEAIRPCGLEQSLITAVASVLPIRRLSEPGAVIDAVAARRTAGGPRLPRPVARILTKPQVCLVSVSVSGRVWVAIAGRTAPDDSARASSKSIELPPASQGRRKSLRSFAWFVTHRFRGTHEWGPPGDSGGRSGVMYDEFEESRVIRFSNADITRVLLALDTFRTLAL